MHFYDYFFTLNNCTIQGEACIELPQIGFTRCRVLLNCFAWYILDMMQNSASNNGKFELYYRRGWAYLAVYPPAGTGRPVYPEDIENRMKLLGVPQVSAKRVRDLVDTASGEAVALVAWPNGQALAAGISVEIAKDGMSAFATIHPPKKGAAPPVLQDVLDELDHAGVVFGIDQEGIQRTLSHRVYDKPIPVAAGREPVYGRAHRIQYHFNVNRGKPYLAMDFGRINLKELNFIDNRKEGELLAELVPPVTAMDGAKVTGETIPAESDSEVVQLQPGLNTLLSPDCTKLYAQCDGNVRILKGKILVEPVIFVKNVNFETGNVRFDGSVVIEGSIADGFVVEAGGDIQVGSSVGKATLKAGGSILLKTGINGNGKGVIECGGDLFAKYIESSTVECRGNVLVEEAIMHSRIIATKHCVLNGRRSEVIASDLVVGGSFWCKKMGNFNEAETHLAIGVKPSLLLDYRATGKSIDDRQKEHDKIELQLDQLGKLIKDGRADERMLQAQLQLHETLGSLEQELATLKTRFPGLRERIIASRKSIVVVEETMFKGVIVTFGSLEYRVPDAGVRKMILKAREGQIIEAGFNFHERPVLEFETLADAPSVDLAPEELAAENIETEDLNQG